mmetsp:Transcript_27720/g.80374  ORF Transcript_27720/g.80374 Transcript_27720/m.80374 type:complete len:208 (-) Transcript_27720:60-683(-)
MPGERPLMGTSSRTSASSQRSRHYGAARSAGAEVLRSQSVPQLAFGGDVATPSSRPPSSSPACALAGAVAPQVGNFPCNNIPGYTGYIPGKYSENILGTSHSRTNALALQTCNFRGEPVRECDFARQANAYGIAAPRRGADMPGYSGYIPGKHASNVYGMTFAESNNVAQHVRRELAVNRVHRAPAMNMAAGPTCWTGNAAVYAMAS